MVGLRLLVVQALAFFFFFYSDASFFFMVLSPSISLSVFHYMTLHLFLESVAQIFQHFINYK